MWYQPIINLSTDSIIGFEALARLRTEKYGLVSPFRIIPIAEKRKLIIPIGEMVLVKALRFLEESSRSVDMMISVSPSTFLSLSC